MPGVKGRSGRRRKPLHLHLLQGTYRRDRHGTLPPAGPPPSGSALGAAPDYLRGRRARELWGHLARLAPWLESVDRHKAGMWCALQAEWEQSRGAMRASRIAQLRLVAKDLGMRGGI